MGFWFMVLSGIGCRCIALRFDPEPMRGSPAGMTAATGSGRSITSGGLFEEKRDARPACQGRAAAERHRSDPGYVVLKVALGVFAAIDPVNDLGGGAIRLAAP
jgi:hypothetical protein